jgi:mRNA interferase YafQ
VARELVILPRFKRDYRIAKRHVEFDQDTLAHVFDLLIAGESLPAAFKEHALVKRARNWAGFTECHLGADLLLIYRMRATSVVMHRIGTHSQLFSSTRKRKTK